LANDRYINSWVSAIIIPRDFALSLESIAKNNSNTSRINTDFAR